MRFGFLLLSFWSALASAANCGSYVPGQFRYNVASATLEYCSGPSWMSSKVANTNLTCSSADVGRTRYFNSEIEFCDGYYWYSTKGSSIATATPLVAGKMTLISTDGAFSDGSAWYKMSAQSTNGAFVLTANKYNGNLGGLAGAGTTCFKEVTNYDWYDKGNRGVISPWRVTPWLCDGSTCNDGLPTTVYNYALANSVSGGGGTTFTTDASGIGPNAAGNWATITGSGTGTVWSGHLSASTTKWGGTSATTCTAWSGTAGNGITGTLSNTGTARWAGASTACTGTSRLFCWVAPADSLKPDPYKFNDVLNASASTTYTSNIVPMTGFTGTLKVAIYTLGSAAFRVCADATCSASPAFGSAQTTISAGQYLQLQVTTAAQAGAIASVTAYVGNSSASWNVTVSGLAGYFLKVYNEPTTGQMLQLGGLDGANDQCFQKAVRYDWKGKANAGTLTRGRVRAFLCDDQACNNMTPGATYYFGVMNTPATGGASFTTNSLGQGPGNSSTWNGSTYFGATDVVPGNRGVGTSTYWSLNPRLSSGGSCTNWTSGWDTYWRGQTDQADAGRWAYSNGGTGAGFCQQYNNIFCFVDPILAPTSLSFTSRTGLDPLTTYVSEIVSMAGLASSASITLRGAGSPQYRVCSDANCSSVVTDWTSSGGVIGASQYLQVRATTSSLPGTKITSSVSVGNLSTQWSLTTEATTRNGYFVMSATTHTGNYGGLSGANSYCLTELTGNNWLGKSSAPTLTSSNVQAWLCDGNTCNVPRGSTTYAFAKAGSTTLGGATFTTDNIGNFPGDAAYWNDAKHFGSNINFYTGLDLAAGVYFAPQDSDSNVCNGWVDSSSSYSGSSGSTQYSDNGRFSWGSANCTANYNIMCFVHPGASPGAFSFTDQTGLALSTQVSSNIVQITGQDYEAAATASGAGSQVRVCADSACSSVVRDWRSGAFVTSGQYLQVRATTSNKQLTATPITVTVGSTSTTWTLTTANLGILEVQSLSPIAGVATGGSTITITGVNFASGVTAKVNGVACTTSTFVSSSSMTCVVPSAGAGVFSNVDVSVTNPGPTTVTLTSAYFYLGAPRGWYSADSGITQSGGVVSAWADRSGNGNNLSQATAGSRPTISNSVATFNSQPAVHFSSQQNLAFSDMTVLKSVGGASWFTSMVADDMGGYAFFGYNTPVNDNEIVFGGTNFVGGTDLSSTPGMVTTGGARTDTVWQSLTGGAFTAGKAFMVSSVVDFTTRNLTLWVDRSQAATTSSFSTAGTTPNANAGITWLGGGDGGFFNGYIAEFFLYNTALSTANRQVVEAYLKARYNTP